MNSSKKTKTFLFLVSMPVKEESEFERRKSDKLISQAIKNTALQSKGAQNNLEIFITETGITESHALKIIEKFNKNDKGKEDIAAELKTAEKESKKYNKIRSCAIFPMFVQYNANEPEPQIQCPDHGKENILNFEKALRKLEEEIGRKNPYALMLSSSMDEKSFLDALSDIKTYENSLEKINTLNDRKIETNILTAHDASGTTFWIAPETLPADGPYHFTPEILQLGMGISSRIPLKSDQTTIYEKMYSSMPDMLEDVMNLPIETRH